MNRWKIAFWTCFTTLIVVLIVGFYLILDHGVSLTYMQDGYSATKNDLNSIEKIINETDLTKSQIKKSLNGHNLFEFMNFESDTISLEKVNLIFKNNKLKSISEQW